MKRFPEVEALPEEERLSVALASRRHPLFWGTLLVLLALWVVIFGPKVIELTGHFQGRADMFLKLFFPAMVPIIVIFLVLGRVQRIVIKKAVQTRLARRRGP